MVLPLYAQPEPAGGKAGGAGRFSGVAQLIFGHPEVMSHFVEQGVANLLTNLFIAAANRLDIFLVKKDTVRGRRRKGALLGPRDAVKETKEQGPRRGLPWRRIFNDDGDVSEL